MPTDLRRRTTSASLAAAGRCIRSISLICRADAKDRVERGARLLENIADYPAADVAQLAFGPARKTSTPSSKIAPPA